MPLKDIAILVRSNSEALLTVQKLMEQKLPVLSGDALLISNNSAVQLIINTLKTLIGLDAQTALYKANCIALYHSLHNKEANANHYLNLNNVSLSTFIAVNRCNYHNRFAKTGNHGCNCHYQNWLKF